MAVFTLASVFGSLGGFLLVGYANRAYEGMGDAYLMPTIAAVVIGGTSMIGNAALSGHFLEWYLLL